MNYVLLIYTQTHDLSPAKLKATLGQHKKLQADAGLHLLATAQLDPPSTAQTVRIHGENMPVVDGPYMESKEWLVGFYLLRCATQLEAVARARQICSPNHAIEVRPANWHKIP